MKAIISISVLSILLLACTTAQINQTLHEVNKAMATDKPLTTAEVGEGLKEALVNGISKGSDRVSQLDGYFKNPEIKIPFPPEAKKVEDKLRQIGMDKQVDEFIMTLNRGAENAAKEAKPIFISAIKQMTIEDAWSILKGNDNAATNYLQRTTSAALKEKFKPVIQTSLDKVNATKYYSDLVNTYNKIPFVEKVNPDLNEYATNLAMRGLFLQIEKEEKNIRKDPLARTSDLLKRVFGTQQK
ncbi:MAG: DUF4197 domain-containing protein [Cyclobacteriaceae bacterium]|nr:DUF4197 domain-containing protein [Flammeovirgaceae bacterium]MCZ8021399.1 DUF4197 domain-containing protein [Cytophagales bacterium]MCZ8327979.1 DUF4197 domain-containing protein [Cyclobacteriaceae bacterium]